MVGELALTTITDSHGKITPNLPTSDVNTVITVANNYYQCTLGGTLSPTIPADNFYSFGLWAKVTSGSSFMQAQLRKSDGVTVIASTQNQSSPTAGTWYWLNFRGVNKNTTPADLVNCQLWVKSSGTHGVTFTTQQDSLVFFHADKTNAGDEVGMKRMVNTVYFISCNTSEGILGIKSTANAVDEDFIGVDYDCVTESIQWTANSGSTLYSYGGASIGIATT